MLDAIIGGPLQRPPRHDVGRNGAPYITCVVRAVMRDGTAAFIKVFSYFPEVNATLGALKVGDSVAFSGELSVKLYRPEDGGEPRPSLDLLAHSILTHFPRRQETVERAEAAPETDLTDAA